MTLASQNRFNLANLDLARRVVEHPERYAHLVVWACLTLIRLGDEEERHHARLLMGQSSKETPLHSTIAPADEPTNQLATESELEGLCCVEAEGESK
jgi:hypothetical protein